MDVREGMQCMNESEWVHVSRRYLRQELKLVGDQNASFPRQIVPHAPLEHSLANLKRENIQSQKNVSKLEKYAFIMAALPLPNSR